MEENTLNSQQVPPAPDPELRRLHPLIGTWTSSDPTLDSILGPGVPVINREGFSWLEGGYFLVQTYDATFGNEPAQKDVNYWFYDSETQKFRIIFFSNNGPYTEEGNRYEGKNRGWEDYFHRTCSFPIYSGYRWKDKSEPRWHNHSIMVAEG